MAHWVERLFPPTFTIDDFHTDTEAEKNKLPDKAKELSAADTSAIKNVYERVCFMEQIHQKSEEAALIKKSQQELHEELEEGRKLKSCREKSSCIWNEGEINELRKIFMISKEQNIKLNLLIDDRNKEMNKINACIKTTQENLVKTEEKLQKSYKANQKLDIRCESLQKSLSEAYKSIKEVKKELRHLLKERHNKLEELHSVRIQRDKLMLQNEQLIFENQAAKREKEQEKCLSIENVKSKYETEMSKLLDKINTLTLDLDKEMSDHGKTKKGLEHLRKHFASLPTDHAVNGDMVNDVQKITFY